MVFMYTLNDKMHKWWKNITFIVWGPSSELLSENKDLQKHFEKFIENDIKVLACKACADEYGVSKKLSNLGINVKYMGKPLTNYIKDDHEVVTF